MLLNRPTRFELPRAVKSNGSTLQLKIWRGSNKGKKVQKIHITFFLKKRKKELDDDETVIDNKNIFTKPKLIFLCITSIIIRYVSPWPLL